MKTKSRFKSLSISVFGITIAGAMYVHNRFGLDLRNIFGDYTPYILIVISLFSYDFLYTVSIKAIDSNSVLKKIYWGSLYLDGLWSYTSRSSAEEFFGVWRIDQSVLGIKVVAFGLDNEFRRRSTVESVSDVLGEDGVFEVINSRWDLSEGVRQQFSRTVLVPDQAIRHWVFSYPDIIRGETMIYGSSLDGSIAYDLRMKRRRDCRTEDELIAKLQQERSVQAPARLREAASH
jgi:hypothetical protein